jgi:hypothetical protein
MRDYIFENINKQKDIWLPQMKAPVDYIMNQLTENGIKHNLVDLKPKELIPLQKNVSRSKVIEYKNMIDTNVEVPPIYIADDNEILDGHHRGYAFMQDPSIQTVKCLKLYMDFKDASRILNQIQDRFDFINGDNMGDDLLSFQTYQEPNFVTNPVSNTSPIMNTPSNVNTETLKPITDVDPTPNNNPIPYTDQINPKDRVDQTQNDNEVDIDESKTIRNDNGGHDDGEMMDYNQVRNNKKALLLYKNRPIDQKAKTGDFLNQTKEKGLKHEYNVDFDNLYEIDDNEINKYKTPIDCILEKWFNGMNLKEESVKNLMTQEVYAYRIINEKAKKLGYDGIKYGSKLVQIVN